MEQRAVVITNHDQTNPTSDGNGPPARTAVAMDDPLSGLALALSLRGTLGAASCIKVNFVGGDSI